MIKTSYNWLQFSACLVLGLGLCNKISAKEMVAEMVIKATSQADILPHQKNNPGYLPYSLFPFSYRMSVSVLAIYPCDWWQLLVATPQHHERVAYHILLAWEKIKKSKTQSVVSTEYGLLSHHCKVRKS